MNINCRLVEIGIMIIIRKEIGCKFYKKKEEIECKYTNIKIKQKGGIENSYQFSLVEVGTI